MTSTIIFDRVKEINLTKIQIRLIAKDKKEASGIHGRQLLKSVIKF